uniref:Uncharacterized protein n=1 Tax=Nelumbo nucifera TaxID=4432 RepID=A0A822XYX4_NELNU|nr:TPA_asm: hypothetical protein HUJ06_026686 [Nelumbo nucifera]
MILVYIQMFLWLQFKLQTHCKMESSEKRTFGFWIVVSHVSFSPLVTHVVSVSGKPMKYPQCPAQFS